MVIAVPEMMLPHGDETSMMPGPSPDAPTPARLGRIVAAVVTTLLPERQPDVRAVAEVIQLSARTLQRRLSEEGLTFATVVARARFDAARRMLEDPSRRVVDVALEVGYSDQAHFTRAFVRWTGLSPREFRRRTSSDPSMRT